MAPLLTGAHGVDAVKGVFLIGLLSRPVLCGFLG